MAYVQQIVVKSSVSPWQHKKLMTSDAFRAPLNTVFDILEQLNNYQYIEK